MIWYTSASGFIRNSSLPRTNLSTSINRQMQLITSSPNLYEPTPLIELSACQRFISRWHGRDPPNVTPFQFQFHMFPAPRAAQSDTPHEMNWWVDGGQNPNPPVVHYTSIRVNLDHKPAGQRDRHITKPAAYHLYSPQAQPLEWIFSPRFLGLDLISCLTPDRMINQIPLLSSWEIFE